MPFVDEVYQRCSICIKYAATVSKVQHNLSTASVRYVGLERALAVVFRNSLTMEAVHALAAMQPSQV